MRVRSDWKTALEEIRKVAEKAPFTDKIAEFKDEPVSKIFDEVYKKAKREAKALAAAGGFEPMKRMLSLDGILVSTMFTVQTLADGNMLTLSMFQPLPNRQFGLVPEGTRDKILREIFGDRKLGEMDSPTYGPNFKIYLCKEPFN